MAKTKLILISAACICLLSCAPSYKWQSVCLDGSRTGCSAATVDNVPESLGTVGQDGTYVSPSGREFSPESATAKVASIVLEAQPRLASVKKVIAFSEEAMPNERVENRLSNWFVDIIMKKVESLSGCKVDVGICNFGGIRVGMPEGDVMLDDIRSMFPFKNNVVYLELPGRILRGIFEKMAAGKFEALGGVRIEAQDKKLVIAEIGGRPIDDERMYSVATISFLLDGGDGLSLADGASVLKVYDVLIVDAVLEHIHSLTAEGKSIKGTDVRHVTVR